VFSIFDVVTSLVWGHDGISPDPPPSDERRGGHVSREGSKGFPCLPNGGWTTINAF